VKTSTNRILATHVGSLPRTRAVTDVVFGKEEGTLTNEAAHDRVIAEAVRDVVAQQVVAGVDVVSDGELSKISYATYVKDRISGFAGDSPRRAPQDLEDFPAYMAQVAGSGGTPTYRRPRCVGPLVPMDARPLEDDLRRLREALQGVTVTEAFMNAPSPGVIALFQPNDHYASDEAYLDAIAEAMRPEYEAIVAAGLVLQIDSPDLGLGRHTMYKDRSEADYVRRAHRHVEALNHALRNVPVDRVRMHVCWGNYEGPHHRDVAMAVVLPIALAARPQGLLFESSNPRHAHEWTVFRDATIPDDKILIPGVIDSVTNFVEHPLLVAERICRFADIVGRERVIAGTDCGFSSFAGFGRVDPDIVYAKLASLAEGARIASDRLWGRPS
jgi:5-methyltetrahydropteroyltriglutamate--homocysteine methyltransferase